MNHFKTICNVLNISLILKTTFVGNIFCSSAMSNPRCMRLINVKGFDNRKNDVIYCASVSKITNKSVVVFFGGDVQDFLENMNHGRHSREGHQYTKWNLESTALLLHSLFPNKHVVIIRSKRMDLNTFSCYENFVPVIKYGIPNHNPMNNALQHLDKLLYEITNRIKILYKKDFESIPNLNECELLLIGFSKGCVVLNQFLYEFHYVKTLTPNDENITKIIFRIAHMYWLDGGHSGDKNTWITSRALLETLAYSGIKVHVHVTPYQVKDVKRPWIGKEEKQFSERLQEMKANIERILHFENESVITLSTHFELLTVFMRSPIIDDDLKRFVK